VLIYFGYPEAHEDDAERAVRAGLAVIDAVGRLVSWRLSFALAAARWRFLLPPALAQNMHRRRRGRHAMRNAIAQSPAWKPRSSV